MDATRIVAYVLLVGVGCGPVVVADDATDSSSTSGPNETTSTGPQVEPPASSGSTGFERGDIGECPLGREGCPCDKGSGCNEGLVCDGNLCRPSPNCGDGVLDQAEQCDDGNLDPQDGCSPLCIWERHCFVGQLGDGRGTVRTISFEADGHLTHELDRIITPHQPAPPGLGRSTAACGGLLAHASFAFPYTAVLGPFEAVPFGTNLEPSSPVFEVACAGDTLFLTHQPAPYFVVTQYELVDGGKTQAGSLGDLGGGLPRLFVDPAAQDLYLAVSGPSTTLYRAPYTEQSVGPVEVLGALPLSDADDLLLLPAAGLLVIPSGRVDGRAALFSLAGEPTSSIEGILADRTNVVALPRAGSKEVALGGNAGVVLGSFFDGAFTQRGETLVPNIEDTFVRATMDGDLLVVGWHSGVRVFGSAVPGDPDAPWVELDRMEFEGGVALESGAIVPCP